jgi:hypothetical protein
MPSIYSVRPVRLQQSVPFFHLNYDSKGFKPTQNVSARLNVLIFLQENVNKGTHYHVQRDKAEQEAGVEHHRD